MEIDGQLREDYREDDDRPSRARRQQHRRHRHACRRKERRANPGAERLPGQHRARQVGQRHTGERPAVDRQPSRRIVRVLPRVLPGVTGFQDTLVRLSTPSSLLRDF
jgi:hypothetical protein